MLNKTKTNGNGKTAQRQKQAAFSKVEAEVFERTSDGQFINLATGEVRKADEFPKLRPVRITLK